MAADARTGGVRYTFGGYCDAVAEAAFVLDEGEPCTDPRDSHGTPVELSASWPTCRACATRLPRPGAGALDIVCPGCADRVAVRWPDEETRSWDPRITCIVGDAKNVTPARIESPSEGQVVACGGCGAPLATMEPNDRRRSRSCDHCGGINTIPDAAWLALFPLPEHHAVFLLYDFDLAAELALFSRVNRTWLSDVQKRRLRERRIDLEARRAAGEAAQRAEAFESARRHEAPVVVLERLAMDRALTPEEAAVLDGNLDDAARSRLGTRAHWALVSRWLLSPTPTVRAIVAAHPHATPEALERLARDRDASVRMAVAGHQETPPTMLARLRRDENRDVREAARRNASYRPGLFERLFSR
jgi:hypothetical protein